MKLAVIGKDVSKSDSPKMHTFIAEKMGNSITYDAISIPEDAFEKWIDGVISRYDGFNVTIPYKLAVMPKLKSICGDAKTFGAVNTVRCADLSGHNTDGLGFMLMLKSHGVNVKDKKVLLLGAGGAGRAVSFKLTEAGANLSVYDRNPFNASSLKGELPAVNVLTEVTPEDYYLIINATGVGMHKTEGMSPVGKEVLARTQVALDLIYVPTQSEFLRIAEGLGKPIINGMEMLFFQAYYAECIYFGCPPDEDQAYMLFADYVKYINTH